MKKQHLQHGFTLMELSIVILILSIMIGGIMAVITQNVRIQKQTELQAKLDRIKEAMLTYRKANNRLPCPGNLTQLVTAAAFGIEGGIPTTCDAAGAQAANFVNGTDTVYGGSVPVKTLNLALEDAFDPWGNRFLYAIDKRITNSTANNPFKTYLPSDTGGIGNIIITDYENDVLTSRALYIVLTHGANGHGAYGRSGVRKSSESSNAFELENCDCSATASSTSFDETFKFVAENSNTAVATQYDDKIMFVFREQMLSAEEEQTELR